MAENVFSQSVSLKVTYRDAGPLNKLILANYVWELVVVLRASDAGQPGPGLAMDTTLLSPLL